MDPGSLMEDTSDGPNPNTKGTLTGKSKTWRTLAHDDDTGIPEHKRAETL